MIRLLAMLARVQPGDLLTDRSAHADTHAERSENARRKCARQRHRDKHRDRLHSELAHAAARKQAIGTGGIHRLAREHAGEQRADDAGHAMAGKHVERVVHQRARAELHGGIARHRTQHPDRQRGARAHESRSRRDGHEPDHRPGRRTNGRRATSARDVDEYPRGESGRGRNMCRRKGHGGHVRCREGRPGVETEPAKPEQPGAEEREGHAVRHERRASNHSATSEQERRDKCRSAGAHVHDSSPGKVQGAEPAQPAAVAPYPVRERIVHECRPGEPEEQIRGEAHPLDDGARNQRNGDHREHRLKQREGDMRDRRGVRRIRRGTNARKAPPRQAAECGVARCEGERIADDHPLHGDDAEWSERHHHAVERVLAAHEPTIKEREARHHQHHEGGGHQHPCGITRRDGNGIHASALQDL